MLSFPVTKPIDVYLYAKSSVTQTAPSEALAAERYINLSQLSRSLVAAIPLTGFIVLAYQINTKVRWYYPAMTVFLTLALFLIFLRSWMVYKSAGVYSVLRAFLVHS